MLFIVHITRPSVASAQVYCDPHSFDPIVLTHEFPPPPPPPGGWLGTLRGPGAVTDSNIVWVMLLDAEFVESELLTGDVPAEIERFHAGLKLRQGGRWLSGRVENVRTDLLAHEGTLARVSLDAPLETSPLEVWLVREAGRLECGPLELMPGEPYTSTEAARRRCWSPAVVELRRTLSVERWRSRPSSWRLSNFTITAPPPGPVPNRMEATSCEGNHRVSFEVQGGRDILFFEALWLDNDGVRSTVVAAGPYIESRRRSRVRRASASVDLHSPFSHMFLRAITVSGERQGLWVYEVSSGQLQRWTPELGIPVPESPFDALF